MVRRVQEIRDQVQELAAELSNSNQFVATTIRLDEAADELTKWLEAAPQYEGGTDQD